jgi:ferredoxin
MRPQEAGRRLLARTDAGLNRLYGWRWNPFYHSGALVVALLAVLLVTGVYLLLFYRVGAPWESTARITEQAWAGRWIRGLHRFASDAALVAIAVHAFRMFVQGRSWGARAIAWVSGVVLLSVFLLAAWTGYVMVWDVQAQVLAVEGARLLDALPLWSEPIGRAFVGERPIPPAFFFLNLFLHVALPIGMALVLWLHVVKIARPVLWPARRVLVAVVGLLLAASVLWPVGMEPRADLLRLPDRAAFDVFFSAWIPLTRALPAGVALVLVAALGLALAAVPWWTRPRRERRPAASRVEERLCTGCEQCVADCPYEAITMVPRAEGRAGTVAQVDPGLCVSCGICAGSCAPMGVGPPGRSGRDQLGRLRTFLEREPATAGGVLVIACSRGAGGVAAQGAVDGAPVLGVDCVGSLHTSVVEGALRGGAAGVLLVACPATDCWNREGARWLEERLFHGREAELQARVDRRRVRLAHAAEAERGVVAAELAAFRASLPEAGAEAVPDVVALCARGDAG